MSPILYKEFITELINDVPSSLYEILSILFCVCIIAFFIIYSWEKAIKASLRVLLWEYVFLIYSFTVFFRSSVDKIWHNFSPFWSYRAYYEGENASLLPEIIMNIVGFIPLGFLLGSSFQKLRWWQIILAGLLISVSIEALQYFFKLGIAEFDDVFNNTLGVAIGYILFEITNIIYKKLRRILK